MDYLTPLRGRFGTTLKDILAGTPAVSGPGVSSSWEVEAQAMIVGDMTP
ncbi:hypothetical protein G9U51_13825 [Calidifontibacter sp. DB0510]|uniref:Uncharacterized protein n=1 Tax=Metallococcus carri TaxID=1656884 RepID=A0A967E9X3_9MICO|nr:MULTISPECIES: hypothetical protein [Micrococcales]MBM7827969.1 hypothetical protein [Microbacterium aurum]NHN56852.1 hypothetical protein [Metallococcus carri]NOP37771.1 hypothetical protein [Calidifontibacter sp. DB2511S]